MPLGYSFDTIQPYINNPGQFRVVDRTSIEYLFYNLGDTLKLPNDIVDLFNALTNLSVEKKEKFNNAAAQLQFSEIQKPNFPSAALAYGVVAINALIAEGDYTKDVKNKIKTVITECFPNVSQTQIEILYKDIRCAHFHEGKFPAGEFEMQLFNPFAIIENTFMTLSGHAILRSTLIKWLLNQ